MTDTATLIERLEAATGWREYLTGLHEQDLHRIAAIRAKGDA